MNPLSQFADHIIKEQELIIGPVAWEEAGKVSGLMVDVKSHEVDIEGDARDVLERLVAQYESLFGKASLEVCRDAVRPLLAQVSEDEIPKILQ